MKENETKKAIETHDDVINSEIEEEHKVTQGVQTEQEAATDETPQAVSAGSAPIQETCDETETPEIPTPAAVS